MKTHILLTLCLPAALSLSQGLDAAKFLMDSFAVADPADRTQGEYREGLPLIHGDNAAVHGGSMVGFTAEDAWAGNSQLPRAVARGPASATTPQEGGAVEFRGFDDQMDASFIVE